MKAIAALSVIVVALLHVSFLALEMFLWQGEQAMALTGLSAAEAALTASLAANQGLYNGFVAAGLLWAQLTGRIAVVIFFLIFVVIAGCFGALTASFNILFMQAAPGALALLLTLAFGRKRP